MSTLAADVKAQVRLEDVVVKLLGDPLSRGYTSWLWRCPFHNDTNASFGVNLTKQTWRCFGACDEGGDIFDLFHKLYGDTLPEAIGRVTGQDYRALMEKPHTPRVVPPKLVLTSDIVQGYARNWMPTEQYFHGKRAISVGIIKDFSLGTQENSMNVYRFKDGTEQKFYCRRFVIPWKLGDDQFYQLSRRRDDDQCRLKMSAMPSMVARIREDLALRGFADVSDMDLMEFIFGGKYKRFSGTQGSIFNLNQIFAINFYTGKPEYNSDGLPVVARMEYNLISEAPVSALSIESLGYSATAVNLNLAVNYRHAYSGVHMPVILADNDGGTGLEKAKKLADRIGNPLTRILVTPEVKDPNELIVLDQQNNTNKFGEWMARNGIPPLFKRKE